MDALLITITIWSGLGCVLFCCVLDNIRTCSYKENVKVQMKLLGLSVLCGPVAFATWIVMLALLHCKSLFVFERIASLIDSEDR